MSDTDLFYLQDSRSYVGNDVLWWKKGGRGYTTDLREAEVYSKADAVAMHQARETDIPWPKAYIDQKTRPAVDFQYIKRAEALEGTGIVLLKPQIQKRQQYRCHSCNIFLSATGYYSSHGCPRCGTDNRP